MKKYSVACPALVFLSIVGPLIICIPALIGALFFGHTLGVVGAILLPTATYCIMWLIFIAIYRNAYRRFKICDEGIRNKKIFIPWNEIKEINMCEVELWKYSLIPTVNISILYCGCEKNTAFYSLDASKCVFFVASERNVKLLKKYCENELVDKLFCLKIK